MRPLTRQTSCFKTTIWGSFWCREHNSCLTDSNPALCSADNCTARTSPVAFTSLPKTTRESPRLAMYSVPLQIMPSRQQEPTAAIWGFAGHCLATRAKNPSSVAWIAFRITSTEIVCCSDANPDSNLLRNQSKTWRIVVVSWVLESEHVIWRCNNRSAHLVCKAQMVMVMVMVMVMDWMRAGFHRQQQMQWEEKVAKQMKKD